MVMKKEAAFSQDNVAALVESAKRGHDISIFKANPYTGQPISPEDMAEAQRQIGVTAQVQQAQPQLVQQPQPQLASIIDKKIQKRTAEKQELIISLKGE